MVGGAQAIIRPIRARLEQLGGRLRLGAKVEKILVEHDAAVGVQLGGGETIAADWVISAADGHATIYEMLGGKYTDAITTKTYATLETFPSYMQVSLGVAREFPRQAGYVMRVLDTPLALDPDTELRSLALRFFHFDPTFAPPEKTAVTCFLPTRNVALWTESATPRPDALPGGKATGRRGCYRHSGADGAGCPQMDQVTDVSTPATIIRYTGNWKGSMEGWLMTPTTGARMMRNTLPGLRQFLMVGHWVAPGGGLPSGVVTARSAVRTLCKQDRVEFAGH